MKRLLWLLLLCSFPALGQSGNTVMIRFPGAPSGSCSPVAVAVNGATGAFYDCLNAAWNPVGGGGGTVTSGTQGEPAVYSSASVVVSSPLSLDATQFSGADMSLQIANCLTALYAISTKGGICDASGFTGNQTWSVNPFSAATNIPITGTLKYCTTGTITVQVPIIIANYWSIVKCGTAQGAGNNTGLFQADAANFPNPTSPAGTISVGTAGYEEVLTGSGTAFTANMVGCAIIAPSTQPTPANGTFGIINSVNVGAQTVTLGYGVNNGTGAGAGSSYVMECPIIAQGDGHNAPGNPYENGIKLRSVAMDCNGLTQCVGLMNWFSDEGSDAVDFYIKGFNNIGFDWETGFSQNAGPYEQFFLTTNTAAGCTANTIPFVSRTNAATRPLRGGSINVQCASSPVNATDIHTYGFRIEDVHFEGETHGVSMGANTSCPVACPFITKQPRAVEVEHIDGAVTGGSLVFISNAVGTPLGVTVTNVAAPTGAWTNLLADVLNSCTAVVAGGGGNLVLSEYDLNYAGAIAYSTSTVTGCRTPSLVAGTNVTITGNPPNQTINSTTTSSGITGTSASIGGGALIAGQCATGTATVTGALTSMVASASPNTYPGAGFVWAAQVTSADTATVYVCAQAAGTPTSSTYNVIAGGAVAALPVVHDTWCQGTIGATNGGIYALEPGSTSTTAGCGQTTTTEIPLPSACTAKLLSARVGTAATTGISVTLYKNTVATALTVALGTATAVVQDSTHTVSFAANDTWSIRAIPGQATETAAQVRAAFICQ